MKKKRKKKMKSLTMFIIFSFAALIIYTIISQAIAIKTGMELSTLTGCFFAAFGGEILSCALIKVFKLKEGDSHGDSSDAISDLLGSDDTGDTGDQSDDAGRG